MNAEYIQEPERTLPVRYADYDVIVAGKIHPAWASVHLASVVGTASAGGGKSRKTGTAAGKNVCSGRPCHAGACDDLSAPV